MSRLTWTDPAPLEVERPRLPWWTMLPRKLLWAVSPIIAVVVVVMVLVFIARRVWRYPLFLIGGTMLASLGVGYSWWASAGVLAGLGVAGGLWACQHPDSLNRTVVRQVRSAWRRALVYAWPWKRVMLFSDLTKHTGHDHLRTHYPTLTGCDPMAGATGCRSSCCTASAPTPTPPTPRSWRTPSGPAPAVYA